MIRQISSEDDMAAFARDCATVVSEKLNNASALFTIFLRGDLGAGKTAWTRSFLRTLGVDERVPSPTFNVVLHYQAGEFVAHHLDCYRLQSATELYALGPEDWDQPGHILIVEWPERIEAWHTPDWWLNLQDIEGQAEARRVELDGHSDIGCQLADDLDQGSGS
ncbi:MAG: tRNA (adenosine(37)-N6)-threonylcarbamoyltransferase complex ATPase subunit type 1 TsaE [Gammaproteobacteria bacterium]|nr:tRNA (adenosine(37)-N6)-threonylcarbamoyltransferase complex ATPase subunit type 1 TsaE [Gammaproteobacteria bacterium]